jgi:hypothetical protein
MIMSEKEWELHCIDTGCTMSYNRYLEVANYIIGKFKNEKVVE